MNIFVHVDDLEYLLEKLKEVKAKKIEHSTTDNLSRVVWQSMVYSGTIKFFEYIGIWLVVIDGLHVYTFKGLMLKRGQLHNPFKNWKEARTKYIQESTERLLGVNNATTNLLP